LGEKKKLNLPDSHTHDTLCSKREKTNKQTKNYMSIR